MAKFLKDQAITNLTINREAILSLAQVFNNYGKTMPEYEEPAEGEVADVSLVYTIRFDQKGYQVYDVNQLLGYFEQATKVERLIIELLSGTSLRSNRVFGSSMTVQFDTNENVQHFLTVTSDNEEWMTGAFAAVIEVLGRHRNNSARVRNQFVERLVQITGLFIGFSISVWAASKLAPVLVIEQSFFISFAFVLLVFANFWYQFTNKLNVIFPKMRFYRPVKDKLHWIYQSVIGSALAFAFMSLVILIIKYVIKGLSSVVG